MWPPPQRTYHPPTTTAHQDWVGECHSMHCALVAINQPRSLTSAFLPPVHEIVPKSITRPKVRTCVLSDLDRLSPKCGKHGFRSAALVVRSNATSSGLVKAVE